MIKISSWYWGFLKWSPSSSQQLSSLAPSSTLLLPFSSEAAAMWKCCQYVDKSWTAQLFVDLHIFALVHLTRSFFFLSGVMKPFLAFLPAAWASSRARTSAFFRSISDILLQKRIRVVRQIFILSGQYKNHIKAYIWREHRLRIRCSFTYSSSPILVARPELKEPLKDAHSSPSSQQVAQHSGRTGQGGSGWKIAQASSAKWPHGAPRPKTVHGL